MRQIKKLKLPKKINWKKRFWKVFSEYIRKRDGGKCFTCSTQREWNDDMNAGHYVNAGKSNPALYFSGKNVHCQCTSCNLFKSGNLEVYALRLARKYGAGIFEELETLRNQQIKWNAWTYQMKIEEYKNKIKILESKD
jgi:hypothetical protein